MKAAADLERKLLKDEDEFKGKQERERREFEQRLEREREEFKVDNTKSEMPCPTFILLKSAVQCGHYETPAT